MSHSEDNNKTVITLGSGIQPETTDSYQAVTRNEQPTLPIGTRVAEFEILSLVGVGGFGIVYKAHDHSLGRTVALKEYMPTSLAFRTSTLDVGVLNERYTEAFTAGLNSFINEAHILAMFDHPALVKVYRFWEANRTAYMAMPFYEGLTLKQSLTKMSSPPSEQWLKELLYPLIDALQLIHGKHCYHRDIAPDNILMLDSGQPVLLDFGAARQVIGDMTKNLTVILKQGYAPIEQYAGDPSKQGAWTDIYSLGAVVHYAITGNPPVVSVGRLIGDANTPLEKTGKGRYSPAFLRAIDKAIEVSPDRRPQDVLALRQLLDAKSLPADDKRSSNTAADARGIKGGLTRPLRLFAGALFVLLLVVAAWTALRPSDSPVTARTSAPVSPPPLPKPADQPQAGAAPVTGLAPAISKPFDLPTALERLFDRRDSSHLVSIRVDKSGLKISQDKFRFHIKSSKGGYLYVMMLGTDKAHLNLLFPNALESKNKILADKETSLPGASWTMTADGPPGIDQFVAMVSDSPREFTQIGLKKVGPFGEFSLEPLATQDRLSPTDNNALAGQITCPSNNPCPSTYGAAKFSIEEFK